MKIIEKIVRNEKIIFCNQRALFWEKEKMLILSDVHVGKSAHFRKYGIPISAQVQHDDLQRLKNLIDYFSAKNVVIVGDLFHANYNSDLDIFKKWRQNQKPEFTLIKGNHDRLKKEIYEDLGISSHAEFLDYSPFRFTHHFAENKEDLVVISGHIHPGFLLQGKNETMRLPCFLYSDQHIILPAFSKFTGLDTQSYSKEFSNIVFSEGTIFEI